MIKSILAITCAVGACAPADPAPVAERPPCTAWDVNGTPTVTFMAADPANPGCDVAPPMQLDIVFVAADGTPTEVAASCDDMGGRPDWTTEGDWARLICHDVDY